MNFTLTTTKELGISEVFFWTTSASGYLAYIHFLKLIETGLTPLKDASYLTNGYLDTVLDWIPGLEGITLKDLPSWLRTTNLDDYMIEYTLLETKRSRKASAVIINTFQELDEAILDALSSYLPPIYTIGPLHFLENLVNDKSLKGLGSNLWKEEPECLEWLDSKDQNSVVYINFGSITTMTSEQLVEFACGLANSQQPFLWIIRPDLVLGDSAILPAEFLEETKERGLLASWCPQEKVLGHSSVGGFLTHSAWNSTLESISNGVPMIYWPFFADQPTNCWLCCNKLGIGIEIDNDIKRDEVESLVRELVTGEKGKGMKKKALELKNKAEEAAESLGGSSWSNLEKVIQVFHRT
ncbi:hypothetical protein ACH5RR_026884 [Cinchona calisaya]|uniref:UDP-glycosyltransferases domain-containing protein n=1 Tax=Cinchona calisaya TaxID=153742 RepID=A0ABD2Z3V3_9GENT